MAADPEGHQESRGPEGPPTFHPIPFPHSAKCGSPRDYLYCSVPVNFVPLPAEEYSPFVWTVPVMPSKSPVPPVTVSSAVQLPAVCDVACPVPTPWDVLVPDLSPMLPVNVASYSMVSAPVVVSTTRVTLLSIVPTKSPVTFSFSVVLIVTVLPSVRGAHPPWC